MCVTYAVMRQAAGEAVRLRICLFHCSKRFFAMQRFSRSERRDTDAARRTPKPSAAQNCPTTVFSSENGPQAAFSAFPSRQSAKRRRPDACLSALETVRSQRISIFFQKTLDFLLHPCYDNEAVSQEAHGVLAQLGERHTGSVEVSGSIPLCSTRIRTFCESTRFGFFFFFVKTAGAPSVWTAPRLMFSPVSLHSEC